jgi:hypothetical protein
MQKRWVHFSLLAIWVRAYYYGNSVSVGSRCRPPPPLPCPRENHRRFWPFRSLDRVSGGDWGGARGYGGAAGNRGARGRLVAAALRSELVPLAGIGESGRDG